MVSIPQPVRLRRNVRPIARCSRRQTAKAKKRTAENVADGFLRHQFLPLRGDCHTEINDRKTVEKRFFNSLANLADLYRFDPLLKNNAVYPCNIANAFQHAQQKLQTLAPDIGLAIIQDDTHTATLATYKEYVIGQTLYYIPMRPLWDILRSDNKKQQAGLLSCVFAYLLQVIDMPCFAEQYTYLHSEYLMLWEYYAEDESMEEQDWQAFSRALKTIEFCGSILQKKIKNPYHLDVFAKRLQQFIPTDKTGIALKEIATGFFNLYEQFPKRPIWDSIYTEFLEPLIEDRVFAGQYLSLVWDTQDCLFDEILRSVNTQVQECMLMDNPLSVQFFDMPQTEQQLSLAFEKTLFGLLDDLYDLLKVLT